MKKLIGIFAIIGFCLSLSACDLGPQKPNDGIDHSANEITLDD